MSRALVFTFVFCSWLACQASEGQDGWLAPWKDATEVPIRVVDREGEPVSGVRVGTGFARWEYGQGLNGMSGGVLTNWGGVGDGGTPLITDTSGLTRLKLRQGEWLDGETIPLYAHDLHRGRVGLTSFTIGDAAFPEPIEVVVAPSCRVHLTLTAGGLAEGQELFQTVAYLDWGGDTLVLSEHSTRNRATFFLPPGDYRLRLSGFGRGLPVPGSGGIPTEIIHRPFTIDPSQRELNLGEIALPVSPIGRLVGRPAPPLGAMALWKNTEPMALEAMQGRWVVLLFFEYGCSGTLWTTTYADLLRDRYAEHGLEIIAVHDADPQVRSADGFDRLVLPGMLDAAASYAESDPASDPGSIDLPIAIQAGDPPGSTADAYRVTGRPTGVLIGPDGTVRHVFAHGLNEAAIRAALGLPLSQ